ncbi:hypothetical protein TNCT_69111 [Trichonephila clavata]|uniref:Uncharacterized protein n=1 Tax=Trichonephila clavata TaxID=2740835 RepID=A0A8X6GD42_TRICU|nr:hypothetical protein TNCT_69111 [Trichonephila clavata]
MFICVKSYFSIGPVRFNSQSNGSRQMLLVLFIQITMLDTVGNAEIIWRWSGVPSLRSSCFSWYCCCVALCKEYWPLPTVRFWAPAWPRRPLTTSSPGGCRVLSHQ